MILGSSHKELITLLKTMMYPGTISISKDDGMMILAPTNLDMFLWHNIVTIVRYDLVDREERVVVVWVSQLAMLRAYSQVCTQGSFLEMFG